MTKVNYVICPSCGDKIYSRARHDYRTCECGEVAVDGGLDYLKISFKGKTPKTKIAEVNASPKELYDDWNLKTDKFGRLDSLEEQNARLRKIIALYRITVKLMDDRITGLEKT